MAKFDKSMLRGLSAAVEKRMAEQPAPAAGRLTGAGQHMQARMEADLIKERINNLVAAGAGSTEGLLLDPKDVVRSKLANRMEPSFLTQEFKDLKTDIARTGGNVQAICVTRGEGGKYTLIFGHRRLRACQDLGFKVRAIEVPGPIKDETLFLMMHSENAQRSDPSVFEQGVWFQNALARGIFPSARALATAVGVSHVWVMKAMQTASLPAEIVQCFASPIAITSKATNSIMNALDIDRDAVMLRAAVINDYDEKLPADKVVQHLLYDDGVTPAEKPRPLAVGKAKPYGSINKDAKGRSILVLSPEFSRKDVQELLAQVEAMAKAKPALQEQPKPDKKAKAAKSDKA